MTINLNVNQIYSANRQNVPAFGGKGGKGRELAYKMTYALGQIPNLDKMPLREVRQHLGCQMQSEITEAVKKQALKKPSRTSELGTKSLVEWLIEHASEKIPQIIKAPKGSAAKKERMANLRKVFTSFCG